MPYIGRDLNRGNYLKLDDISSSFDSSTTTFNLTVGGSAFTPGSAFSILVSVGGVIQEPESAYQVNNSEITFANAPTAQDSFFCIALGVSLGIGVPGNGTVNGPQLAKPFNYDGFFYLDDANNRVGINSSSPTVALDVSGTIKGSTFSGPISNPSGISTFYDVRVTNNLTVEGSTTTLDTDLIGVDRVEVAANSNSIVGVAITQSGTADIVNLFDGTTEVLTVTDGGKVGIGTENPSHLLHLQSASSPAIKLEDTTNTCVLLSYAQNSNAHVGTYSNHDLIFDTDSTEKVRITSAGEVGIGTVTPESGQLQVIGSGYHQINISGNKTANANKTGGISFLNYEGSRTSVFQTFANNSANTIYYGSADSSARGVQNHIFYVNSSRTATSGHSEALRIDSSGNVIIKRGADVGNIIQMTGADTTSEILEAGIVSGHVQFTASYAAGGANTCGFIFRTRHGAGGTNEKLRITSTGQVQINRDGGGAALTLGATQDFRLYHDAGGPTIFSDNNNQGLKLQIKELNLTEYTGATSRLKILSNGNVEVKASGADQKRSIKIEGTNGSSELQGVVLESDGENAKFHIKTGAGGGTPTNKLTIQTITGNIGVNNISPDSALSIAGTGSDAATRVSIKDGVGIANVVGRYGNLVLQADVDNAINGSVMTFEIDGGEAFRVTSGRQIGIGTITPRAKFDVRPGGHSGNGAITFTHNLGEVGSSNNAIQSINGAGSALQPLGYRATEHIFATQSAERLRIHSHGQLELKVPDANDALKITPSGTNAHAKINFNTPGTGAAVIKVQGTERLSIGADGRITNTGIATSYVTTSFAANYAKLDLRGTNIANSNHYILSYGEGHANDHQLHMVNTLGSLVFRTGTGSNTERLLIDTGGRISNNNRVATSFGSPNLLISGINSLFTMMGDGSINNSSYTGIKFRVAGASTGDYTKAGIFAQRRGGYNDLDMLFCFNTTADASGVTDSNAKVRITSGGRVSINQTNPTAQLHSTAAYNVTGAIISGGAIGYNNSLEVNNANGVRLLTVGGNGSQLTRGSQGGRDSTGNASNFMKIGTWYGIDQTSRLKITIFGTLTYDSNADVAGETIIYISNNANNTMKGHFHSHTNARAGVQKVAFKYDSSTSPTNCQVWIKYNGGYSCTQHKVDASEGYWVGADVDTSSTSVPSGATEASSFFAVATSDGSQSYERLRITSDGKVVAGGNGSGYPCRLQSHGSGNLLDLNSTSGAGKILFYESGVGRFNIETLNGSSGLKFYDSLNSKERLRIAADGTLTKYYNSTSNPQFYLGGTSQVNGIAAIAAANQAPLVIGRDSGNAKSIHCSGNIQMASGYGIDFSATNHPSGMTSELLDDYEEGSWTPNPSFATTGDAGETALTDGGLQGQYVKIGRLVYYTFSINFVSRDSSSSGNFYISGLPYNVTNTYWNEESGFPSAYYSGLTNATGSPSTQPSASDKLFFAMPSSSGNHSGNTYLTHNNVGTGNIRIRGGGVYRTAS